MGTWQRVGAIPRRTFRPALTTADGESRVPYATYHDGRETSMKRLHEASSADAIIARANELQAKADRVAAGLVTEQLGGSISADLYELAVIMTSHSYMLGYANGQNDAWGGAA